MNKQSSLQLFAATTFIFSATVENTATFRKKSKAKFDALACRQIVKPVIVELNATTTVRHQSD